MYFIYELAFEDGSKYVGCTNNIRRRKDQHNGCARNRKSRLGRYLNDMNIVLKESDFKIVESYEDRREALRREREITKSYASNGINLLNDTYSNTSTRIGAKYYDSSKEYVVIDFEAHTATKVFGLKPYCEQIGLDYKLMQRTAKHDSVCYKRYKAFLTEEWEAIQDKDFYLSGKYLQSNADKWMQRHIQVASKEYEVKFPDGHTEIVKNLDRFAREHSLTSGTLHATFKKNKPTKGYQVVRRI